MKSNVDHHLPLSLYRRNMYKPNHQKFTLFCETKIINSLWKATYISPFLFQMKWREIVSWSILEFKYLMVYIYILLHGEYVITSFKIFK